MAPNAPKPWKETMRLLPTSAIKELAHPDEVRALYFRTTTSQAFAQQGAPPEAKGENFVEVHAVGQRDGKYMGYQLNRAPLLNRSACKYTQDFVVLPLGDCKTNTDLAKVYKDKTKQNNISGSAAPFDATTKYTEDFRAPSQKQTQSARPKSAKPKIGLSTTLPRGHMLETTSFSHDTFAVHLTTFASEKAKPPQPNLHLPLSSVPYSTSYKDQFTAPVDPRLARLRKLQRCASAPAAGRGASDKKPKWMKGSHASQQSPELQSQTQTQQQQQQQQQQQSQLQQPPQQLQPQKSSTKLQEKKVRPASAVAKLHNSSGSSDLSIVSAAAPSISTLGAVRPASALAKGMCRSSKIFEVRRCSYMSPGE
eukprot:TRINITY_DN7455_c0_g1_i1.p1 TRINITY_DN7455_c0_g1~~TRINITY_DN7455_c0_g1_i1.p1  ORF type:complete len:366 (+),score=65.02 TRINITY_DN7455_c0_g1_i1:321-1418(+)